MSSDYKNSDHFRNIAPEYANLRTTDLEPIHWISNELNDLREVYAADIGSGTGRYTQLLNENLGEKLKSTLCVDFSARMLGQLKQRFSKKGIRRFAAVKASAMDLPLRDEAVNCIFTFNAIHHFTITEFLKETSRILQEEGYLFVYTRLRRQNSRNIWGRFFPLFASKETRLFEQDELLHAIAKIPVLRKRKTHTFKFNRKSNLKNLKDLAKSHSYSTFDLYSQSEFSHSLNEFAENLQDGFDDPTNIQWIDENILLIMQKKS